MFLMNCVCLLLGASITAYRDMGQHIVALEKDEAIFKVILLPMKRTIEKEERIEEKEEEEDDNTLVHDAMEVEVFSITWQK